MVKNCLLIIFFIFFAQTVFAQSYLFENYSSDKGLSQNSCYAIAQDADGFMWFATQDGLNRFDGRQFQLFHPQNEIGKKIPSTTVTSLYYDTVLQKMWVGTFKGLCFYNLSTHSIQSVNELYPAFDTLSKIGIKQITQQSDNVFWIATYTSGIVYLNLKLQKMVFLLNTEPDAKNISAVITYNNKVFISTTEQVFTIKKNDNNVISLEPITEKKNNQIRTIYAAANSIWIGTYSGDCYTLTEDKVHQWKEEKILHAESGIGCFSTDKSGFIWIGTRGKGIIIYDPLTKKTTTLQHDEFDKHTISRNFVLSIFKDRQNLMWCGLSGSGIDKFDPLRFQFTTLQNRANASFSLPDNMVFKIVTASPDSVFVATQNKGVFIYNPSLNKFFPLGGNKINDLIKSAVYDICEADNKIWLGSWDGLLCFDKKRQNLTSFSEIKNPVSLKIYAVIKLKHADSLFVSGEGGSAFFSLKEKKFISNNTLDLLYSLSSIGRYMYEDKNDNIWLTTLNGLYKYNYKTNEIKKFNEVSDLVQSVRHIYPDGIYFYLATNNGVIKFNTLTEKVVAHIKLFAEGSNHCYSVIKDDKGIFWAGTNRGLCSFSDNKLITNYSLENGLEYLEFNGTCAVKDDKGSLWFGGVGGITTFKPGLLQTDTFAPEPLLTQIVVNDEIYRPAQSIAHISKIELQYNKNFITLNFNSPNYSNNYQVQYSYKLTGIDKQKSPVSSKNFAVYTSLSPGTYVFEVEAIYASGLRSGTNRLTIVILPPWYGRLWFRMTLFLLLGLITYLILSNRYRVLKERAAYRQKILQTEIAALKAQMNPHFIFNCINSIDAFIHSNDKYNATLYLNKFAKLLRNVLDSSKENTVPLAKDIETLKLYIELEELRHEKKFTSVLDIDKQLLTSDYKVPPLIIQPFVENAILHGLKNKETNDGLLQISIKQAGNNIEYIITDNGIGRIAAAAISSKKESSYGMQISYDRIKLFNKEETASVEVIDTGTNGTASGTIVKVQLKFS